MDPGKDRSEPGVGTGRNWWGARETVLLTTFLLLIVAFAITALAAGFYHDRRRDLAEFWYAQGTEALRSGRASEALSDLQTALIYARQDVSDAQQQVFALNFAEALAASHRLDEAHAYLLDLWESAPDNARVNLELARLAAAMGNDADAQRYYANAIYGIWQGTPEQVQKNQRDTQLEFCRYLLDHDQHTAAQSVLLAVAASLPRDPGLHAEVGSMMLEAGAPAQALEQYQQVLEIDRRNLDGLVGAGLSSFALGDYRSAARYLGQAAREDAEKGQTAKLSPNAQQDLSIATADLSLDMFEPGLSTNERAQRAQHAFQVARTRLEDCAKSLQVALPTPASQKGLSQPTSPAGATSNAKPAPDDLAAAYTDALKNQNDAASVAALDRNPQTIDSVIKTVFEMESAATAHCGPPADPEDEALARIAQRLGNQGHE